MININIDWLPIGSVIRIIESEHPIMITAFMAVEGNTNRIFDYCGCLYPEGMQKNTQFFFNREQIGELLHLGPVDDLSIGYLNALKDVEGDYLQQKLSKSR